MRRAWLSAGSLGLGLSVALSAASGQDGAPPLNPPTEGPPPLEAPTNAKPIKPAGNSAKKPAATTRTPSPVTRLRPANTAIRRNSETSPAPTSGQAPLSTIPAEDAPPPLDGPIRTDSPPPFDQPPVEVRRVPDRAQRSVNGLERRRVETPDPVILAPIEGESDLPPPLTANDSVADEEIIPKSTKPPSSSARKRFGLTTAPLTPRGRNQPTGRDSSIRVEPRSDPAADAALKRKLEAKVKDAVGNRARDIEVRVVDRNVMIRAKVDRFWNRRNVRRTIETLPALSGYKAKVEIDD